MSEVPGSIRLFFCPGGDEIVGRIRNPKLVKRQDGARVAAAAQDLQHVFLSEEADCQLWTGRRNGEQSGVDDSGNCSSQGPLCFD